MKNFTEEVYGQKEQEELNTSYKQSLANRKERVEKKYPDRPITGKEWIEGYRKWKNNSTPSNYANGCKACKQDIAPDWHSERDAEYCKDCL